MNRYLFFTILSLSLTAFSCGESSIDPSGNNILLYESFESPIDKLVGWWFGDPALAEIVEEAPEGGDKQALRLSADWAPTLGFIYRPITGVKSGDILTLSAYVRATSAQGGGMIALITGSTINSTRRKTAESADQHWQFLSVTDTVQLAPNDTVWVLLSSFNTEAMQRRGLFDLVKLERQ
ncbi:MAG: hypothetical protein KDD67_15645 [Ignavibacteriae bacterium]|nr:hypothetical protein [Ignavibacteriota bacterium]MCB9215745.1 hypothetical protein [Ignavibacteria bacterium]